MPQDKASADKWMDRAASGDDEAFGPLASSVQDDLYRFALAHGLNRSDSAEAVQETLLRAYRMRRRWRQGGGVRAWLCGIEMNVVRELRRRHRRREFSGADLDVLGDGQAAGDGPIASRDEIDRLAAALAALPARQREAVACRFLRQMSVKDTAKAMGCAEGTVKAAVFAALENLRRTMVREE